MKGFITKLVIVVFFPITIFACDSPTEKLDEGNATGANENVEAKIVLTKSEKDSLEKLERDSLDQWQKFKTESEAQINNNKKNLASLQASIANRSSVMKVVYRKAVIDLAEK